MQIELCWKEVCVLKKAIRSFALVLCLLLAFAGCSVDNQGVDSHSFFNSHTPNTGADIAFIAPADEYQLSFIESVWNAVEQFAGKEGYSKAPYRIPEQEEYSTLQLAVKSGAKIVVMAGTGMDVLLLQAQVDYPEIFFLHVSENGNQELELADNSAALSFRPEQAGWLAGYLAMYEAENNFAYFEAADIVSRRYALGFFFGVEAAAETMDLAANSIDISPIYIYATDAAEEISAKTRQNLETGVKKLIFSNIFLYQEDVLEIAGEAEIMAVSTGYDYLPQSSISTAVAQSSPSAAVAWVLSRWSEAVFPSGEQVYGDIANRGANLFFDESRLDVFGPDTYREAVKKFSLTKAGGHMLTFIESDYVPSPLEIEFSRIKPL